MNLAIVGIGLIGGSVAIRLKEKGNFSKIIGVDKSESNQKKLFSFIWLMRSPLWKKL